MKYKLKLRLMPRDVVTRWNSTYDMLTFSLEYRKAVDEITSNRDLKLRQNELDEEEWIIIEDLAAILKVIQLIFYL